MCNEYYRAYVDGEWRWVRWRARGRKERPPQLPFDDPRARGVFPDRMGWVIALGEDGPEWREMRWGFPSPQPGGRPVTNVRNTASSYWKPWLKPEHRVVVPFDEFVEFTDAAPKRKHYFRVTDNQPAAFAGIWRPWRGVRGPKSAPVEGEHELFAFLTTEANEIVRPIHAKAMPVVLVGEDAMRAWLAMPVEDAIALQARVLEPSRLRVRT